MPYKDPEARRRNKLAYKHRRKAGSPELFAFEAQRENARRRGIPFLMTFEEWWVVWQKSDKWRQRGKGSNLYVMARFGDAGPYTVDNVRICTGAENATEAHRGKAKSQTMRRKNSSAMKAAWARKPWPPINDETRRKMSESGKARWRRWREE